MQRKTIAGNCRLALLLAASTIAAACGSRSDQSGGAALPSDPADWVCAEAPPTPSDLAQWCADHPDRGQPAGLIAPPPLARLADKNAFDEVVLQEFLRARAYVDLGWHHDLSWRFTGPYVGTIGSGDSYGTHPAVRIYYSPEMIDWLCGGRVGDIPDGALIVKEMASIRPCLDIALDEDGCMVIQSEPSPTSWTVMIRAREGSQDGWYWSSISAAPADPPISEWQKGNPPIFDRSAITSPDFFAGSSNPPEAPNPLWYPTGYVFSDPHKRSDVVPAFNEYGLDCINCHASAAAQSTFASLDNLITSGLRFKGFQFAPGTCDAAAVEAVLPDRVPTDVAARAQLLSPYRSPFTPPLDQAPAGFRDFFHQIEAVGFAAAWEQRFPADTYDHVVSPAGEPDLFLTSDQCAPCHDATISNAALPKMVVAHTTPDGEEHLLNLSPYGEWKASPMGLGGRDPIFFAQLQTETNTLPSLTDCIEDTCLHCHGVMGQRQFSSDTRDQGDDKCKALFGIAPPPEIPFGLPFRRAMVAQWPGEDPSAQLRYAALARDGISCTVCHHLASQDLGEERTYTGNFLTGPADEIYGPYETDDVAPKSMQNAIGVTPMLGEQMLGSDACGTCHNILLPVFDNGGRLLGYSYEQSTHLEWLNSDFAPGRPDFATCQDCHMPTHFKGKAIRSAIANIEDDQFAPTTFRLPDEEIAIEVRDRFSRHSLHGLNVFLNQMFQQFPLLLGHRQIDYLTGTSNDPSLVTGAQSIYDMAAQQTATVAIERLDTTADGRLDALIEVKNEAGHYLPSGVGFRRVFLELLVLDAADNVLWASGRTNDLGVIVTGRTSEPLPSEDVVPAGSPPCARNPSLPFEDHHELIEREDQVQIYQELMKDSDGVLTTSFLRRVEEVKDNRLRPKGYDPERFRASPSPFIRELGELAGAARFDSHYSDPALTGSDEIRYVATLDPGDLGRAVRVQVTLYSQSIPPFYLQQRFNDASCGPAARDDIQRLYYMTSHLNVDGATDETGASPMQDWKLRIASASRDVAR